MKTFIHEYGLSLFCIICIIFLICTGSPVSAQIKEGIGTAVTTASNKVASDDGLLANGSSAIDSSMREMNVMNAKYEFKYYTSIDKASADANNMTTENADATKETGVIALGINDKVNTAQIVLLKDTKLESTTKYTVNVLFNLNGKTLKMAKNTSIQLLKDFRIKDGSVDCEGSARAITGAISASEQANGEFLADNVTFKNKLASARTINVGGANSKDIKITNCVFDVLNMHPIYAAPANANVEISNCNITNTCTTQSSGMFVGGNQVVVKNNTINTKNMGIYANSVKNIVLEENNINCLSYGYYSQNSTSTVNSGNFSVTNEGQTIGFYVNGGKITVNNATIKTNSGNASKLSVGIYLASKAVSTVNNVNIEANGKYANYGIDVYDMSELYMHGGTLKALPWYKGGNADSDGAAIVNYGKVVIDEDKASIVASGGNSGIIAHSGSNSIINGGSFASPNHGGAYVACGSSGHFEINGGTFYNNKNEYDSELVKNIRAFGAMYIGSNKASEKWSVTIKNAKIINECGEQGLVQKSNDGYIPATINLYNTTLSGKSYDVVTQNNSSVGTYEAYVNIYKGSVLSHNTKNDNYGKAVNKDYIIDHR